MGAGQNGWHDEGFRLAFVEEDRLRKQLASLKNLASSANVIGPKEQNEKVDIGNEVIIEYEDGSQEKFTIEGYIIEPAENLVSSYSPLGKVLKGAKKGEAKIVEIQGQKQKIKILEILPPSEN